MATLSKQVATKGALKRPQNLMPGQPEQLAFLNPWEIDCAMRDVERTPSNTVYKSALKHFWKLMVSVIPGGESLAMETVT